MNKEQFIKIFYVCITILLITLTLGGVLGFINTIVDTVSAETIEEPVYNFNQLYNNQYTRTTYYGVNFTQNGSKINVIGRNTATWQNNTLPINDNNIYQINIDNSHIFYINFNYNNNGGLEPTPFNLTSGANSSITKNIDGLLDTGAIVKNISSNTLSLTMTSKANGNYNFTLIPQIIDLTQMYGERAEDLTLEQVKELLPTTYNYTEGTLISSSYLDGYNNGAFAMQDGFTISVVASDFINNAYSVNTTAFTKVDNQLAFDGLIAVNTNYTLLANDYIIVDIKGLTGGNFDIQQVGTNGNFITLQHIDIDSLPNQETTGGGYTYGSGKLSIKLQNDTNTIYFNGSAIILVANISYKTFNYSQAIVDSFNNGRASIDVDAIRLQGYNKGYQKAQEENGMFADGFNFLSVVFNGMADILSIEFIPNVPIWSLLAIPVLLGIIALVRKLTGG